MRRADDWACVAICLLTLVYVLWYMARAGWLF